MSDALDDAEAFEASRRSTTTLLADLTRALPKEAALVAFRIDTAGGTLVALGTRAAQVMTALEAVKEIASPEIVGPVTRETMGGREVERVTVRFRFADPASAEHSAQVAGAAKPSAEASARGASK